MVIAGVAALQAVVVALWLRGEAAAPAGVGSAPVYERAPRHELAPDLIAQTRDGDVRLSQHRGQPVLLHFWATWCPPCHEEIPELLAYGKTSDAVVMAVSVDESFGVLEHYFDGRLPPAVSRVDHATARALFGAATLPLTVLIDERCYVRGRFAGAQRWQSPAVKALVRAEVGR